MTGKRRSADRIFARRSGVRAAFTLAALLAVFLQAFVVQTHIHASGLFQQPAIERTADAAAPDDAAHAIAALDHQQGCIICQALAANGGAALPDAAQVAASTNASYETAALEIRRAPRAVTHSWQSRAPPIAA
jgi:hypothetical protein